MIDAIPGDHDHEPEHHVDDRPRDRRLCELALRARVRLTADRAARACTGHGGGPDPVGVRGRRSRAQSVAEEQRRAHRRDQLTQDLVVVTPPGTTLGAGPVGFGTSRRDPDARLEHHERQDHDHHARRGRAGCADPLAERLHLRHLRRRPGRRPGGGGPAATISPISTPMRFTAGSSTPCERPRPTM